jgi:hypothetical protein
MKKLFFLIPLFLFLAACASPPIETGELDNFAQCLNEKGVRMYGSFLCSVCKKQRDLFGSSFQYVGEIECHPKGENPQTQRCLEMDIAKTPTWILEKDGKSLTKLDGYQTIETLAELSGCTP